MTLPTWPPRSRHERQQVLAWASDQIDKRLASHAGRVEPAKFLDWLRKDGPALESAKRGDYEPLRRSYPHLAPYINPPPLKRGEHTPKTAPKHDRALAVLELVPIVQEIWRKHYGKQIKKAGYGPSALEIAASYLSVPVDAAERARKNAARTLGKSLLRR